jgi:hypothetical protein
MRDKIFKFISTELSNTELNQLLNDLEKNDGKTTIYLVKKRLRQIERSKYKVCASCGKDIDAESDKFILTFGPDSFQKRAHFCAADCMNFFLENIGYKEEVKIEKLPVV